MVTTMVKLFKNVNRQLLLFISIDIWTIASIHFFIFGVNEKQQHYKVLENKLIRNFGWAWKIQCCVSIERKWAQNENTMDEIRAIFHVSCWSNFHEKIKCASFHQARLTFSTPKKKKTKYTKIINELMLWWIFCSWKQKPKYETTATLIIWRKQQTRNWSRFKVKTWGSTSTLNFISFSGKPIGWKSATLFWIRFFISNCCK